MKQKLIWCYIFFSISISIFSQVNISYGTNVYISNGLNATIADSLVNSGSISFDTTAFAKINFTGQDWSQFGSLFGNYRLVFKGISNQSISGSNLNFTSIEIDNSSNLSLNNELIVDDSVIFSSGKILLNKNNLTLGNTNSGIITGYDDTKYIVTNGLAIDSSSGFLIRKNLDTNETHFPIGNSTNSYTPISIKNSGTSDDFKARVFDSVFSQGYSGVYQPNNTVNKTWEIKEATTGGSFVRLKIQHKQSEEGAVFTANKSSQIITKYIGTTNNSGGDTISLSEWANYSTTNVNRGFYIDSGTITTGTNQAGYTTSTFNSILSFSLFSKFSGFTATPLPVALFSFTATKASPTSVLINWKTAQEIHNKGFWLQRSSDAVNFENLTWKDGQGTTKDATNYNYLDEYVLNGYNYYRLKQVDDEDNFEYSRIVVVNFNSKTSIEVSVYPNPVETECTLSTKGIDGEINLVISDISGKVLYSNTFHSSSHPFYKLDFTDKPSGNYLLNYKVNGQSNSIIITKK